MGSDPQVSGMSLQPDLHRLVTETDEQHLQAFMRPHDQCRTGRPAVEDNPKEFRLQRQQHAKDPQSTLEPVEVATGCK